MICEKVQYFAFLVQSYHPAKHEIWLFVYIAPFWGTDSYSFIMLTNLGLGWIFSCMSFAGRASPPSSPHAGQPHMLYTKKPLFRIDLYVAVRAYLQPHMLYYYPVLIFMLHLEHMGACPYQKINVGFLAVSLSPAGHRFPVHHKLPSPGFNTPKIQSSILSTAIAP